MKYWESGHRQGCRRPTTLQREDCISGHALAQSTMDGPSHSVAPEISRTAGASTEFPGRCAERGSWLRRRRRRTTGLPGRRSRRAKRRRPPRRRWRLLRRRRMTRRPARRRSGPAVSRTAGSSRAWTTPARTAVCVCVCARAYARACVSVRVCVCARACSCVRAFLGTCVRISVRACAPARACVCVRSHVPARVRAQIACVCARVRAHSFERAVRVRICGLDCVCVRPCSQQRQCTDVTCGSRARVRVCAFESWTARTWERVL